METKMLNRDLELPDDYFLFEDEDVQQPDVDDFVEDEDDNTDD